MSRDLSNFAVSRKLSCLCFAVGRFKARRLFVTVFYSVIQQSHASRMSQADKVNDLKIEIQKLLGEINRDMNKLKSEVVSLNHILEGDSSLATNAEMVNERLMIAAKEAGLDLEDLETQASEQSSEQNAPGDNAPEHGSSEQDETERENGTQESTRNNEQTTSTSNAAELAAAADKLTKAVKRTLR